MPGAKGKLELGEGTQEYWGWSRPGFEGEASLRVKFGQVLKEMSEGAKRLSIWGRASRQRS